jgi:hypothetical protein
MTAEAKNSVIRLEYRDFEIAKDAITSSINDTAALKNALQHFLSSPEVTSSLTRPGWSASSRSWATRCWRDSTRRRFPISSRLR